MTAATDRALIDTLVARIARDAGKTEQTIRAEYGIPATEGTR